MMMMLTVVIPQHVEFLVSLGLCLVSTINYKLGTSGISRLELLT